MLTKTDVIWAYRVCLNRDPESEVVVDQWIGRSEDRPSLTRALLGSNEYKSKNGDLRSPFWHYHTSFNPISLIEKFTRHEIASSPEHVTNFLGVKVRPVFFPPLLANRVGSIEPPPLPSNWHADIAEWGSCLRAVDEAGDRFVMLELGCGWGCWMNNLGVAAKTAGKKIYLYGVEAALEHTEFAREALADNGIDNSEFTLVQGIAGKAASQVLFPKIKSGIDWGGSAIFNPSAEQLEDAKKSGKFALIPVIDLANLLARESLVDLIHVDIQGAELDLLREIFALLCEKVRFVFIGTHSKAIEAGLFDLFLANGQWKLEMERAAIFSIVNGSPGVICDGVQLWRNSTLV